MRAIIPVAMVLLASLAGVPLTAGFIGKFLVFAIAVKAGLWWGVAIAIIAAAAGFYYYFKVEANKTPRIALTDTNGTNAGIEHITGKPVAENDKERVRQRIARAIFHEYGISVDDMEPDFKVKVDGSNKKIDIAIFGPGTPIPQCAQQVLAAITPSA